VPGNCARAPQTPKGSRKFAALPAALRSRLGTARIARLVSVGERGSPHAVPVCFVYYAGFFYSPIDRKPKRVEPEKLARLRNIAARPQVALLIDHYEKDWTKLWFVLIRGKAQVVRGSAERERRSVIRALKKKYRPYAAGMLADDATLIRIDPQHAFVWGRP
jgi:PPOX class probable F420-dependent enzyme